MTDRRSFLAKLLCLPAAAKAVAVSALASPEPVASPYKMFYDPHTYAGEWEWVQFPSGMGNTVRTPYDV